MISQKRKRLFFLSIPICIRMQNARNQIIVIHFNIFFVLPKWTCQGMWYNLVEKNPRPANHLWWLFCTFFKPLFAKRVETKSAVGKCQWTNWAFHWCLQRWVCALHIGSHGYILPILLAFGNWKKCQYFMFWIYFRNQLELNHGLQLECCFWAWCIDVFAIIFPAASITHINITFVCATC